MNTPPDTAGAASLPPKQPSEPPTEELVPLTKWEILDAYSRLAGQLASDYCGS